MSNWQTKAFTLYAKHRKLKTVVTILNGDGERTSSGNLFSAQTLKYVLQNKNLLDSGVVSKELWHECQDILSASRRSKVSRSVTHLFSGLLFCSCGQKMYVPTGSEKYVCNQCRLKVVKEDMEAMFIKKLNEMNSEHLSKACRLWPNLGFEQKREIVEVTVSSIKADSTKVKISLFAAH